LNAARVVPILGALAALTLAGRAAADDAPPAPDPGRIALGLELDLLPTVVSAAAGEVGGGGNVWLGRDRLRLRLVGTRMVFPDGFQTPSGFKDRELIAVAAIVDVFLHRGFSGPWIGGGLEHWWNRVGSAAGPDTADWRSYVVTAGGGWAWKFWRDLYLNPWMAGHVLLSRPEVTLYGSTWKPGVATWEISLKVGWNAWL
jgi:hypothetical protein